MQIQWYPGHMTKARRAMKEDMKLIDLVIELVDARMPLESRNPDIDELAAGKSRLLLLNKADLADETKNQRWIAYFAAEGIPAVEVNARSGAGLKQLTPLIQQVCQAKLERDRKRGIQNRPIRTMVVGIPNVGKSSFINSFAGRACAKTGNRPGVTKGNQWIRLNKTLELLDTPGILWPRFEDPQTGLHLALIGSVNDEILDREELALELIAFLDARYPQALCERYGIGAGPEREADGKGDEKEGPDAGRAAEILSEIARARGCLLKGQELDTRKAAALLLDDFRAGRLGRITLETPEEAGQHTRMARPDPDEKPKRNEQPKRTARPNPGASQNRGRRPDRRREK